ncbi:MAG: metallophosphoesterase [Oscillospiraceae bacterium]|nr:metallophosphoesterase [Oscillospiraceae bacterium]
MKIIIFLVGMLIYLFFYAKLKVTRHVIKSSKIKKNTTIVLLADLHSVSYGKEQKMLLDCIAKQKPDIVVMSGDMVDDRFDNTRSYQLMSALSARYPCFFVTGNHEYLITGKKRRKSKKKANEIKETLKSLGIRVLDGKGVKLPGNIGLFGVDDVSTGKKEFRRQYLKINQMADARGYNILLQHKPEFLKVFKRTKFDLMLSGHTHGGQAAFPMFNAALYASGQGFFPKYFGGEYILDNKRLIISAGLTRNTRGIPRFLNPNEVVVLQLTNN